MVMFFILWEKTVSDRKTRAKARYPLKGLLDTSLQCFDICMAGKLDSSVPKSVLLQDVKRHNRFLVSGLGSAERPPVFLSEQEVCLIRLLQINHMRERGRFPRQFHLRLKQVDSWAYFAVPRAQSFPVGAPIGNGDRPARSHQ